ncbi:methyltransferase [Streptomyces sp. NPDC085931]|uniref:methyltransferase n=1 Tax=Streptomyces sp. NPDC085931 TaxID=3365740 RepID=UPI0037CEDC95
MISNPTNEQSCLPGPSHIAVHARDSITRLVSDWRQLRWAHAHNLSKECTARAVATALAKLCADPAVPFKTDDLVENGMDARHSRLLTLLTPLLRRYGFLEPRDNSSWQLTATDFNLPESLWRGTIAAPAFISQFAMGAYLAEHLEHVLRGQQDPLMLLVPEPVRTMLGYFYDLAPVCRFHNRLAQALLQQIVRHQPTGQLLRVLEVGAGTGGLTAALLPLLPPAAHYTFTDVAPSFLTRAQQRFAAHERVEYRTLDIDRDPAEQGFRPYQFDLVVAGNTLHTAKDLEATLCHLRTLLAPGGHLLGVEAHDPEILALVFGTLDSFYGHTDKALRPSSLLLARDQWPGLLERCGYTDVVQVGDDALPLCEQFSTFLTASPRTSARLHHHAHPHGIPSARTDDVREGHPQHQHALTLGLGDQGPAYRLQWSATACPPPGPGEVLLDVHATALSDLDIAWATGRMPEAAPSRSTPSHSSAGVITECGPGVTTFRPGDRVAGLTTHHLASRIVADARFLRPIPGKQSFTEASTWPSTFTAVRHRLSRLPHRPVVLHRATDGTGLAVLQYLRAQEADVIAIVTNDLHRAFLRGVGVRHVSAAADRTLAAEARLPDPTQAPEADEPAVSDSVPFRADTAAPWLLPDDPERLDRLLTEVTDLVARRRLHPLPHLAFPAARVTEAFALQQSTHSIGMVVITFDPLDEPPAPPFPPQTATTIQSLRETLA